MKDKVLQYLMQRGDYVQMYDISESTGIAIVLLPAILSELEKDDLIESIWTLERGRFYRYNP